MLLNYSTILDFSITGGISITYCYIRSYAESKFFGMLFAYKYAVMLNNSPERRKSW